MLVVGTARPELLARRPGWGGGKAHSLTLSLSPLSDAETAHLVHALLDRPALDPAVRARLVERAAGNPLYAEEFARMVEERDPVDDLPLPETVQGLIAARIDGLSPEEKAILQDAAVLGKVFWLGVPSRLWPSSTVPPPSSASTGWCARSSSAASGARRPRRRPSTLFGTSSSAMSPTVRSRGRHEPTSTGGRRVGWSLSAAPRITRRWLLTTI